MSLQMKLVSDLLKSIFDTRLRLSRSFFGKTNWFGQKVTTIPYSDQLPVLKFSDHLPKPWTDQFVNVNGKQPLCRLSDIDIASVVLKKSWSKLNFAKNR